MNILKIVRLDATVSTGFALKIFFEPSEGEIEHSLHILFNGSIKPHFHNDEDQITEGYRIFNLETSELSSWRVVGAGMTNKTHEIPYSDGFKIIEGSKRGPGIECWPELKSK